MNESEDTQSNSEEQSSVFEHVRVSETCPRCEGTGLVPAYRCPCCGGEGSLPVDVVRDITPEHIIGGEEPETPNAEA